MSTALEYVTNPPLVAAMLSADPGAVADLLPTATLVVPVSGASGEGAVLTPVRGPGGTRLMPAFTDLEALRAWDRHPTHAAIAATAGDLSALVPDSAALLLNPAGPGTHLVGGAVLQRSFPAQAGGPNGSLNDLVDPSGRRPVRTEARDAHDAARAALAADRPQDAEEALTRCLQACGKLGDRLHGAATASELARLRLQAGVHEAALELFASAGETFALLGEIDLAVGALLDGAEAALAAGDSERAEALSLLTLDLVAGSAVSDRIVSVWRRLQ